MQTQAMFSKPSGRICFGFIWIIIALGFMGCAAEELHSGAAKVIVTHQPAPRGCRFIGSIVGEQGGSFTGKWTSNKNLQQGALNDMKNKAYDMGANFVVLENTNAGNTGSGNWWSMHSEQTDVTHMGNAYRCPMQLVGLR